MRYVAAILAFLALASCRTLPNGGTVVGFVTDPPAHPPQPEGFAAVHWIAYAGGFLMIVVGAALFWLLQQPKAGAGLAATGFCTIALALAAAFYAKWLAVGSLVLIAVGIVGALGWLLWYAWNKRAQFAEVVKKSNGSLPVDSLTPATQRSVAKIKEKHA